MTYPRICYYDHRTEPWLSVCFILALVVGTKAHGTGDVAPALRINNFFAAPIWRIDIDIKERYLVRGSADKAVAVWTLGKLSKPGIHRVPPRLEENQ